MGDVVDLEDYRDKPSKTLAAQMEKDPELAAAVARHPVSFKLTPAPKISGGPGPVRDYHRIR